MPPKPPSSSSGARALAFTLAVAVTVRLLGGSPMVYAEEDTTAHHPAGAEAMSAPTGAGSAKPKELPPTVKARIDQGAEFEGFGEVGGLLFWLVRDQGSARSDALLTTPKGYSVQGKVYSPQGELVFDSAARHPENPPAATLDDSANRVDSGSVLASQPNADDLSIDALGAEVTLAKGGTGPLSVWQDLRAATVIEEGRRDAPLVYVFFDPYCPYCHQQWQLLRSAVGGGKLRVRWVPIAVLDGSKRNLPNVLGLLTTRSAAALQRWMTERNVAPASGKDAKVALLRNLLLFGRLQAGRVPTMLYSAGGGRIIVRAGVVER